MAIAKPIWEDTIYTEELADSFFEYHIDDEDDTILYAGKSYKYPDEDKGDVFINDITENFLNNHISFTIGKQKMEDYCKLFNFVTSTGTTQEYYFYNDWSYDDSRSLLNDPISTKIDPRQYIFVNLLNLNENKTVYYKLGLNNTQVAIQSGPGYNAWSFAQKFTADCGTELKVFTTDNEDEITYTYDSKDYCLYYVNAYGGWDTLLIDGNVKRTDQITSSEQYIKKAKTNSLEFGKTKYLNTITPSWTLHTGYLTKEQSSKMHHLIESTEVYLHNLNDDTITPVLITNTSCEFQTYSNNGKKLPAYTITVEASQEKYRK